MLSVLVVEDNPVNQGIAKGLLERMGHRVTLVADGAAAVAAHAAAKFDLILMDVGLPGMSGFEATKVIRLKELDSDVITPIIALTAHDKKGDREICLAAGMDDYIAKPFTADGLAAVIKRVLDAAAAAAS